MTATYVIKLLRARQGVFATLLVIALSGSSGGCSERHEAMDKNESASIQSNMEVDYPVNYRTYSDSFSSAGMPSSDFIGYLKEHNTDLVINVAPPNAEGSLENEAELVRNAGMAYVNIPVIWNEPTQADVNQYLALMQEHPNAHIFLHCQMNMRASAFAFLHRVINLGESPDKAASDMYDVWTPNSTWAALLNAALNNRNIAYSVKSSE